MNTQNTKQENNFDKPFNSQKQLQSHIIDKFARFGHKVRYNFKLRIENE